MLILVPQNNISPWEPGNSPSSIGLLLILYSGVEHLVRSVFGSLIGVHCLSSHVWLTSAFSDEPMGQDFISLRVTTPWFIYLALTRGPQILQLQQSLGLGCLGGFPVCWRRAIDAATSPNLQNDRGADFQGGHLFFPDPKVGTAEGFCCAQLKPCLNQTVLDGWPSAEEALGCDLSCLHHCKVKLSEHVILSGCNTLKPNDYEVHEFGYETEELIWALHVKGILSTSCAESCIKGLNYMECLHEPTLS